MQSVSTFPSSDSNQKSYTLLLVDVIKTCICTFGIFFAFPVDDNADIVAAIAPLEEKQISISIRSIHL